MERSWPDRTQLRSLATRSIEDEASRAPRRDASRCAATEALRSGAHPRGTPSLSLMFDSGSRVFWLKPVASRAQLENDSRRARFL